VIISADLGNRSTGIPPQNLPQNIQQYVAEHKLKNKLTHTALPSICVLKKQIAFSNELTLEDIELELTDSEKPGVIRNNGYVYIVLPMRLN